MLHICLPEYDLFSSKLLKSASTSRIRIKKTLLMVDWGDWRPKPGLPELKLRLHIWTKFFEAPRSCLCTAAAKRTGTMSWIASFLTLMWVTGLESGEHQTAWHVPPIITDGSDGDWSCFFIFTWVQPQQRLPSWILGCHICAWIDTNSDVSACEGELSPVWKQRLLPHNELTSVESQWRN